MPFDPQEFAAKVILGELHSEDMPPAAQDALEAGFDGPAIVRLAILDDPSAWETDQLIPKVFGELGVERPSEAQRQYCSRRLEVVAFLILEKIPWARWDISITSSCKPDIPTNSLSWGGLMNRTSVTTSKVPLLKRNRHEWLQSKRLKISLILTFVRNAMKSAKYAGKRIGVASCSNGRGSSTLPQVAVNTGGVGASIGSNCAGSLASIVV
ncbi:hypothetical protein SAMN05421819_2989 [Bryocella elongata]|uniref:Uncharacterized protein n=1 Tax=Bryocella elongata TaxID=863522 RepID=A0A1H6A8U1_9BACT|nr:hypothetical protein SAMN05421819_2989 [Bryocella elongata]